MMVSDEQRFFWDIEGLRAIVHDPSTARLMDAAAILRRLLMDTGEPLVNKIARKVGRRPRFRTLSAPNSLSDILADLAPPLTVTFTYLSPDAGALGSTASRPGADLSLDQFMALKVCAWDGALISVYDVLHFCSNVAGAVHKGAAKNENGNLLDRTANNIFLNGAPYPVELIRNISNVVIEALSPFYDQLKSAQEHARIC